MAPLSQDASTSPSFAGAEEFLVGSNSSGSNSQLVNFALKAGVCTFLHPSEYAKTLIQIGHEPLAPTPTRTFIGRPALALPSVFKYIGIIKKRDGFTGLYAGLAPRLCSLGITEVTTRSFANYWPHVNEGKPYILGSKERSDDENVKLLCEEIKRGAALKISCVLATQPLQVIAVRTMAQFVGKETKYSGFFGGIVEILNEHGILGFWQGVVPRALGEVLLVALTSSMTFVINKYIMTDKDFQKFTSHLCGFFASTLTYPFSVVGNCMIVSRSGLAAGYPPHMPLYANWTDCYSHLKSLKQLKRGSSLLFRYYTGPQVIVGDRVLPMNKSMLKMN